MEFSTVVITQHYLRDRFLKVRWQVVLCARGFRTVIGCPCCVLFVSYKLSCTVMRLLVKIYNGTYRLQRTRSTNTEKDSVFILLPAFGVKGDVLFADTGRSFLLLHCIRRLRIIFLFKDDLSLRTPPPRTQVLLDIKIFS